MKNYWTLRNLEKWREQSTWYDLRDNFDAFLCYHKQHTSEEVTLRFSVKKVFLEISQNKQDARVSFLIKLQVFIEKETLAQAEHLWLLLRTHYVLIRNLVFSHHAIITWSLPLDLIWWFSLLHHFQSNIGNEQIKFHW